MTDPTPLPLPQPPDRLQVALQALMRSRSPIDVRFLPAELWCLVDAIQLACRHPEYQNHMRAVAETVGRKLGEVLTHHDADLRQLMEAGWETHFDVRPDHMPARRIILPGE